VSDQAEYHRTFVMANELAARPKLTPEDMRYMPVDMQKARLAGESYRQKARAFTAYQLAGNRLSQVWLVPKVGQEFKLFATVWELAYAQQPMGIMPFGRGRAVVDQNLTVVGYIGRWSSVDEILIPSGCSPTLNLDALLGQGVPIFATRDNTMTAHYHSNDFAGTNSGSFVLLTGPDGSVVKVLDYEGERGLESDLSAENMLKVANLALDIWFAVEFGLVIGEFAATISVTGAKVFIRGLLRAGARGLRMLPGLRKDVAVLAAKETRQLVATTVGRFPHPGHLIASLELENGKVVYVIRSIHLLDGASVAELEARAAHLGMLKRAALEAQMRGETEFTVRGIDAGQNFQRRFGKELAERIGSKQSAKLVPSSSGGKNLEVRFTGRKVLDYVAKEAGKFKLTVP